ncbi:hypothetical protein JXA12_02760 [Candidatus Woesearchaeota archaeon]|nr:hypothetical protein [Candidatus Woesearchaeota archaeon]
MAEKNNQAFALIAMVAIVAVVGLVSLVMLQHNNAASASSYGGEIVVVDEEGNVVGDARSLPSFSTGDNYCMCKMPGNSWPYHKTCSSGQSCSACCFPDEVYNK